MTMEIIVKNNSENYVGKVIEIDNYRQQNEPDVVAGEHILQPGESKSFYVYDTRTIRVEEVEEIEIPKYPSIEEELYGEMSIKVKEYENGFILEDYSGKKAPVRRTGISLVWVEDAVTVIDDPFKTREEAVKAGMSQIDVRAPE